MEKKTIDTLRTMICGELEDIAKKGVVSHEQLDVLKDLLDSAKNLEKIEKYQREKEEAEQYGSMDKGYSQRKYYIDADYNPYQPTNSYGNRMMYDMNSYDMRNSYDMGRSYANGNNYNGNSYLYHDPMYNQPTYSMARGYSRENLSPEMMSELTKIMAETQDEKTKKAISDALSKVQ